MPDTQTNVPLQVAADQLIAAPCLVGLFFTAMPILEGKPEDIKKRLSEKWGNTLYKNWLVFVPAQTIKYACCALAHKVLS